jgi:outer membrane protein
MMMKTSLTIAGMAAITALGGASLAFAQAKPAAKPAAARPAAAAPAAAAPAAPSGTPITANVPGICVLSREGIVDASTVGKYVETRLQALAAQVNAELTSEQTAIQTADKDLEAKKTTLAPAAFQQQATALQQRAEVLQQKAQQRDREMQATQQKAIAHILTEASPIVDEQLHAKNCAVVLDGNSILAANASMNLNPGVVTALNSKITQFPFDREHLDAQAPAQQR